MDYWKAVLAYALVIALVYIGHTSGDPDGGRGECPDDALDDLPFQRLFYAIYTGPLGLPPTRDRIAQSLGECHTVDGYLEEAIKYFQDFGVDLEEAKGNPEVFINNDNFTYVGIVCDPEGNYRIATDVFDGFAKVANTPVIFTQWLLIAKTDLVGKERTIRKGFYAMYGILRFKAHGRYFCVTYCDREPMVSLENAVPSVMDISAFNQHWGDGTIRGTIFPVLNGTVYNIDMQWAMSFP